MRPKTKAIIILTFAALVFFAIVCGLVVAHYHVNKARFPDAPPWTWWW